VPRLHPIFSPRPSSCTKVRCSVGHFLGMLTAAHCAFFFFFLGLFLSPDRFLTAGRCFIFRSALSSSGLAESAPLTLPFEIIIYEFCAGVLSRKRFICLTSNDSLPLRHPSPSLFEQKIEVSLKRLGTSFRCWCAHVPLQYYAEYQRFLGSSPPPLLS